MSVNNPGKLTGLIVAMVAVCVLLGFGRIGETPGVALLTTIVGYLIGNGVAAVRDQPASTTITTARQQVTIAQHAASTADDLITRDEARKTDG